MTKNELAEKGRRQFIIFGITILFAAFLIQLNQVEREGLYETEGKTFEKAKVVEIKKDNTTESGNQIGNQLVSLRLLSGNFVEQLWRLSVLQVIFTEHIVKRA